MYWVNILLNCCYFTNRNGKKSKNKLIFNGLESKHLRDFKKTAITLLNFIMVPKKSSAFLDNQRHWLIIKPICFLHLWISWFLKFSIIILYFIKIGSDEKKSVSAEASRTAQKGFGSWPVSAELKAKRRCPGKRKVLENISAYVAAAQHLWRAPYLPSKYLHKFQWNYLYKLELSSGLTISFLLQMRNWPACGLAALFERDTTLLSQCRGPDEADQMLSTSYEFKMMWSVSEHL